MARLFPRGRLLIGVTVATLLAGCGASATPTSPSATPEPTSAIATTATMAATEPASTPTASPTPRPTRTPAPTPTPTPPPLAVGPATIVKGLERECHLTGGTATSDPDGTRHTRDMTVRCVDTVNDPRVSGTFTGSWNEDVYGAAGVDATIPVWGKVRMENAGGGWDGQVSGVSIGGGSAEIVIWWTGTEGYAGLGYWEHVTGYGAPWTIEGVILPGPPPAP